MQISCPVRCRLQPAAYAMHLSTDVSIINRTNPGLHVIQCPCQALWAVCSPAVSASCSFSARSSRSLVKYAGWNGVLMMISASARCFSSSAVTLRHQHVFQLCSAGGTCRHGRLDYRQVCTLTASIAASIRDGGARC